MSTVTVETQKISESTDWTVIPGGDRSTQTAQVTLDSTPGASALDTQIFEAMALHIYPTTLRGMAQICPAIKDLLDNESFMKRYNRIWLKDSTTSNEELIRIMAKYIDPTALHQLADDHPNDLMKRILADEEFVRDHMKHWRFNMDDHASMTNGRERYLYFKHLMKYSWPILEEYFSGQSVPQFYLDHDCSPLMDIEYILDAAARMNRPSYVDKIVKLGYPIRPDQFMRRAIENNSVGVFKTLEQYLNRMIGVNMYRIGWTEFMIAAIGGPDLHKPKRPFHYNTDLFEHIGRTYTKYIDWHKVAVAILTNNWVAMNHLEFIRKVKPDLDWKKVMNEDGTCCKARRVVKDWLAAQEKSS